MTETSQPIDKEKYMKQAQEARGIMYLTMHQRELANEPFAQEVWTEFAARHGQTFLRSAMVNDIDVSLLKNAKSLSVIATQSAMATPWGVDNDVARLLMYNYCMDIEENKLRPYIKDMLTVIDRGKPPPSAETYQEMVSYQPILMQGVMRGVAPHSAHYKSVIPDAALNALQRSNGAKTALQIVEMVNQLHDYPAKDRYHPISKMDAGDLYELICHGKNEIFTSTFQEFSGRIFKSLAKPADVAPGAPQKDGTLAKILFFGKEREALIPDFLATCSAYGAMDKVVAALTPKQMDQITDSLIDSIKVTKDRSNTLSLLTIMQSKTPPEFHRQLEAKLEQAYNQSTGQAKNLFGLVAGAYGKNAEDAPIFYKLMANKPEFALKSTERLSNAELVDSKGRHFQGAMFYDDADGKASYDHFLKTYQQDKAHYHIQDHGAFVEITSRHGTARQPIHLIAAKPTANDQVEGVVGQMDEFVARQGSRFQSFVHRGHSYHLEDTLAALGKRTEMPLVVLGSCGGYGAISDALNVVPNAHIIATQGTGTMLVNDTLLKRMNETIAQGKGIEWDGFWKELPKHIPDARLSAYINPAQNSSISFLRQAQELSYSEEISPLLPKLQMGQSKLELDERLKLPTISLPAQNPGAESRSY